MDGYVDQSASALNLHAFLGVPDVRKHLAIFKEVSTSLPNGAQIHLGVIGGSHFFIFQTDEGFAFTEILACTAPPPFRGAHMRISDLHAFGLKKEPFVVKTQPFAYCFWSHQIDRTHGEGVAARGIKAFARMGRRMQENGDLALIHTFPEEEKGEFPPQTIVIFRAFPRGFFNNRPPSHMRYEVYTAHGYPNEGIVVFSTSVLFSSTEFFVGTEPFLY